MEGSEHQNPPCQQRMGYNLNYDWSTHLRAGYNLMLQNLPAKSWPQNLPAKSYRLYIVFK